jgi:transposase-like protein
MGTETQDYGTVGTTSIMEVVMAKKAKRGGPGRKGYSAEKKAKILAAAKKENLTGAQVRKRFGISTLTFYRWRGPVRGKKAKRGPGRPKGSGKAKANTAAVRVAIQAQVRKLLPQIIREEVARALRG